MLDGLKLDPSSPSGLRWAVNKRGKTRAGDIAGYLNTCGYWVVNTQGKIHLAHRIVFFSVTGRWSDYTDRTLEVDHKDGNPSNNEVLNLRAGTHRANMQNQKHHRAGRLVGASKSGRASAPWQANVQVHGANVHLGRFQTEAAAHLAYCKYTGLTPTVGVL